MDNEGHSFMRRTAIGSLSGSPIRRLLNFLRRLPAFFKTKKVDARNTPPEVIAPPETKPSSFPIMRLPYVAIQEVLKHLDLIELIELSLCSRKCIQLVKIARRNKRLRLRLVGRQSLCLMMYIENEFFKSCFLCVYENNEHEVGINFHGGIINGHKVKYCSVSTTSLYSVSLRARFLKTYWEDQMTGKVEIFKYITDLFQYPRINEAHIHEQTPILRPLYDWIAQKYDGRIDEWHISGMYRSQEDIQYLAEACRKGKNVLYSDCTQQHRFDLNFETDNLQLRYVKWLNLDDMIKLRNQSVVLQFDFTSLTSEDVNGFLKNWIQTTHSTKMKYILMMGDNDYNYDIDVILSEIEYKPRDALPDHPFRDVDRAHHLRTKIGYTIQRNNGELASIFFSLDYSTSFEMIIH